MTTTNANDRRLLAMLRTMDVPPSRYDDDRWLLRNLAINNGEHPDLTTALQCVLRRLDSRTEGVT